MLHCLGDCPHAREVWISLGLLSQPNFHGDNPKRWIKTHLCSSHVFLFTVAIWWWVWKWRNNRMFDEDHWPIQQLLRIVFHLLEDLTSTVKEQDFLAFMRHGRPARLLLVSPHKSTQIFNLFYSHLIIVSNQTYLIMKFLSDQLPKDRCLLLVWCVTQKSPKPQMWRFVLVDIITEFNCFNWISNLASKENLFPLEVATCVYIFLIM